MNARPLSANSFEERFDSLPLTPPYTSQIATKEPIPIETRHSEIPSPSADPWANAAAPAVVPVARVSPATPPPPTVESLAPPNPAPVTAPPRAIPAPAVIAPSAADAASSPQSPVVKSVKTVRVEVEKTAPIQRAKPVRPLGAEDIETLLKQGDEFVMDGDFVSARMVYGRVAEADDARGALAFAATYDPIILNKIFTPRVRPLTSKKRANGTPRREISARPTRRVGWRPW